MSNRILTPTDRRFYLVLLVIVAAILAWAWSASVQPSPGSAATGTTQSDDSLPRCVNDDFNDGSQDLCYSVRMDGAVFVIDSTDTVVSVDLEEFENPIGAN